MNARDELDRRIAAIAHDRESGASELLGEAVAILRRARQVDLPVLPIARALVRAQPTMASVWNAAIAATADDGEKRLERFVARAERAPRVIARLASELFTADVPTHGDAHALRLVTISASGTVCAAIESLRRVRPVQVACSEGRPALEGRRLAARLSAGDIPVAFFTDAAIGHALKDADALIVGADAVGAEWVMNKSGTRPLAAAAVHAGVPVYVVCGRDKFVSRPLAQRLTNREGAPSDVWETPPVGVTVHNPYFDATSLDLITAVISDTGVLGAALVPDACDACHDEAALRALDLL